jgi:hypothetical protein
MVFCNQYLTQEATTILLAFLDILLISLNAPFQIPKSFATIESWLGAETMTSAITEYVCCTKCHALYKRSLGANIPSNCTNVEDFSTMCNQPLFKQKKNSNLRGQPIKVYPSTSILKAIQEMMQRPGFEEQIESWRSKTNDSPDQRGDVSDGTMWREIKDAKGDRFCDKPRSLYFTLNVDWLDVFSGKNHGHNSTGAMYLSCDSLPRSVRMKPTNIISVGVLPGPKEPSITQLYNYLDIIIDDFEKLYHGVRMYTCNSPDHPVVVRAALLKIASDTPAARRVAGFLL